MWCLLPPRDRFLSLLPAGPKVPKATLANAQNHKYFKDSSYNLNFNLGSPLLWFNPTCYLLDVSLDGTMATVVATTTASTLEDHTVAATTVVCHLSLTGLRGWDGGEGGGGGRTRRKEEGIGWRRECGRYHVGWARC